MGSALIIPIIIACIYGCAVFLMCCMCLRDRGSYEVDDTLNDRLMPEEDE